MINISNQTFLTAIFGDEWEKAHVTAFTQDPSNISTQDERMKAWAGGEASKKLNRMTGDENQYFTISLFHKNDKGERRRQKALFDACFVIVADDVNEKIPEANANKLPEPSYKLLTSAGSEQWGWILAEAETSRDVVENLLDGLVAQGLAPDGKDPGMKGVTRYVRLPEGVNSKAKRFVNGKPFKCELLSWCPDLLYPIEALADAFNIDIHAPRNESTAIAASKGGEVFTNHPIWSHVSVTGYNNDWALIDCPNVSQHTDNDPSGAAVLIRDDGGVAFKCHHGSCNGDAGKKKMTGLEIVRLLGIEQDVNDYITKISIEGSTALAEAVGRTVVTADNETTDTNQGFVIERNDDHFNILRYVYITTDNCFYDVCTSKTLSGEALKNIYLRTLDGKKGNPTAVSEFHTNRPADLCLADGVGWVPWSLNTPKRSELIVDFDGGRLVNSWRGIETKPVEGDVSPWLNHVEYVIPDAEQRENVLDYFALIFQKPATKPAYTILHRGGQGVGKDLMLVPIVRALGATNAGTAKVDNVIEGWGDYLAKKKFLIIEEVDKAQNRAVNNAFKTVLAPTATGYRTLNLKGGSVVTQVDCLCTYFMSNKKNAMTLEQDDRRYYVVDSFIPKKEKEYYQALDRWIKEEGGVSIVLDYLLKRDISNYNPMALPGYTKGMLEMMHLGKYDYETAIQEMAAEKLAPFNMAAFTLTTLKAETKKHDVKCIVSSLIEAVEHFTDFICVRGNKKIDGKTHNTPSFFILKEEAEKLNGNKEIYDYWEKYQMKA